MPQTNPPHILVVDDEEAVRELLRDCLELDGFTVSDAADSRAMRARLAEGGVDLITLDLMLGGESGLALARDIRGQHDVPIVMISGKGDTIDRVVGLELGADDYITKPFHPREVVARIRAVLRRKAPAPAAVPAAPQAAVASAERLSFGAYTLEPASRTLFGRDGRPLELTTAEFNLLEALARRPQRVLTRDVIMDALKGQGWTPFDRSIDALVSRLRRKIEDDPGAPTLVKTVRNVGYMLACPVHQG